MTEIGYGAFEACSNLVSITIPNITLIQPYAFSSCHKLTSVVLPKTMQLICAYAFANCNNISTVYYLGTESEWNALDGIGVTSNESLLNAKRYYFSETSKAGCWHYVDGVPTIWQ